MRTGDEQQRHQQREEGDSDGRSRPAETAEEVAERPAFALELGQGDDGTPARSGGSMNNTTRKQGMTLIATWMRLYTNK